MTYDGNKFFIDHKNTGAILNKTGQIPARAVKVASITENSELRDL